MGPLAVCLVAANVVDKTRRSLVLFFDCPPRLCDALRQDFVRLPKAGKVSRRVRSVRPSAVCESDVIMRHIVKPRVAVFNAAWSQHPPCNSTSDDLSRRSPSSRKPIISKKHFCRRNMSVIDSPLFAPAHDLTRDPP
ncbi:hypothetical protein C8034_v006650 [Colletotrichum sidae]|uniref:Uncharacterized protein n=1 Tax=Colletotrichum sidae TaxID=1347389 RepID=A0A4V3HYX2_9PEZI|nr:hypothetical protein C8034_v006650 [Colletotrichum sidae]